MRKAIVIILLAILIYLFFSDPICSAVRRSKFQSIEEKSGTAKLPMSDTEPGVYYKYHTIITFGDGEYTQQEDDFFIIGSYSCKLGKIVARSPVSDSILGDYNPFSGILLWDGERYQQSNSIQNPSSAEHTQVPSFIRIEVDATKDWQVTGVTVQEGERVSIRYSSGLWTFDRNLARTDGIGTPGYTSANAPLPRANLGALIAKIDEGSPFLVGNQVLTTSDTSGAVFLRMNDSEDVGDNEGIIIVEIANYP